ncbi:F-box/WD repeat-containing protein 2-like isoform X2 [Orbicella faveolata]|uniref:F-box/WD repeat-containing protein 2-like isoform X2 n=1 Tax=Orbicella faveolata TaxID=48498 RepID=UPI0009E2EE1C|nr:F-box/WD repeat-containing protein 2-like isoform X2 [Orbicella faveolata]
MAGSLEDRTFSLWLKNFCDTFRTLSDIQKNHTIEGIIDICGPEQLCFLSTKLEILVKRDYLKCLPLELSFHVLKWLDPVSLCKCCLVSKEWNKVILSCDDVWQNACRRLGMEGHDNSERTPSTVTTWKQMYMSHLKNMKKLKDIDAVEKKQFYGHTARVFALYCRGNYLATGSDDRSVRLWDLKTGQCKYVLKAHTCADICFDDHKVITASFDNTVGMWDWNTGENLQFFRGHTAAVFTVDHCDEVDTIVSGSADSTLRIWKMSSGQCLQTRYGHSDWVIKVILRRAEVDSRTHAKNQLVILSMDKRAIKIWSLSHDCEKCLATLNPLESNDHLQPRLQFDGQTIACASETGILLWDFKTLQMARVFTESPAKWLVAYGHMYSLVMDMNSLYLTSIFSIIME